MSKSAGNARRGAKRRERVGASVAAGRSGVRAVPGGGKTASCRQRFGSHMSIAGGLARAFSAGAEVGCDCLQVFVKNQRQWSAPPLTEETVAAYKAAEAETGIGPVIAHATYLINLASPEKGNREKSIAALADEWCRCARLGIAGLVVHPGAHMGEGESAGIARIARSIDQVMQRVDVGGTRLLLETTAGQGSAIGHRVAHLAEIIARVKRPGAAGVCVDTCHVFAAGYDLRRDEGFGALMGELDSSGLTGRVACIHVNDSKGDCGSRIDRHEHIGKGRIRRKGFLGILNHPRLLSVPRILETPKGTDDKGRSHDRINLARLRSYVRG